MTVDQHALTGLMGLRGVALHVVEHGEQAAYIRIRARGGYNRRGGRGGHSGCGRGYGRCGRGYGGCRGRDLPGGRGCLGRPRRIRRGQ